MLASSYLPTQAAFILEKSPFLPNAGEVQGGEWISHRHERNGKRKSLFLFGIKLRSSIS